MAANTVLREKSPCWVTSVMASLSAMAAERAVSRSLSLAMQEEILATRVSSTEVSMAWESCRLARAVSARVLEYSITAGMMVFLTMVHMQVASMLMTLL